MLKKLWFSEYSEKFNLYLQAYLHFLGMNSKKLSHFRLQCTSRK